MPTSSVQSILDRINKKDTPVATKTPGPPLIITGRAERHLKAAIRSDPFSSCEDLQMELGRVGVNFCRDTVISAVRRLDFHSFCAASKPRLTQKQREDRLLWAKERANWTDDQWNNVVWSDESRFTIHGNFHGRRVLRKYGERYKQEHCNQTVKWRWWWHHDLGLFLGKWFWPNYNRRREVQSRCLYRYSGADVPSLIPGFNFQDWQASSPARRRRYMPYWSICSIVEGGPSN